MTDRIRLNFSFKGSRKYIQGPDIYTAVFTMLKKKAILGITNIEMSFHKMANESLDLIFFQQKEDIPLNECVAVVNFTSDNVVFFAGLFENQIEINSKVEFDENKIIKGAVINSNSVLLNQPSKSTYNNIENIVSINKYFLTDHFSTNQGKWLFTKIQLDRDIMDFSPESIELKLVKNIGVKLTKTEIFFDNETVGTIYFSMI